MGSSCRLQPKNRGVLGAHGGLGVSFAREIAEGENPASDGKRSYRRDAADYSDRGDRTGDFSLILQDLVPGFCRLRRIGLQLEAVEFLVGVTPVVHPGDGLLAGIAP